MGSSLSATSLPSRAPGWTSFSTGHPSSWEHCFSYTSGMSGSTAPLFLPFSASSQSHTFRYLWLSHSFDALFNLIFIAIYWELALKNLDQPAQIHSNEFVYYHHLPLHCKLTTLISALAETSNSQPQPATHRETRSQFPLLWGRKKFYAFLTLTTRCRLYHN